MGTFSERGNIRKVFGAPARPRARALALLFGAWGKEDIKKDISPHPSSQPRQLPVPPRAESLPPKRPRTIQPPAPLVQSAVDDDIVEVEPVVKTEPPHDMAVAAMAEEAYEESYDYGEYNPETVEYEGGLMEQGDSGKGENFNSFVACCTNLLTRSRGI